MKVFFTLVFLTISTFASAPIFEHIYKFELKKDERASVQIKELGYEDKVQNFDFYWTLFDNTNIIVHSKFRKFPRQFVLSLRRNLDWASQTLIPDYQNPHIDRARLILEFSDYKKGIATFTIYIEDKDSRLMVEFLDPRKMPLKNPPQNNQIVPMIDLNQPQTTPLTRN
ncbi:exporting protein [Campylobacter upsaliensis]|uniref:exporting protein n=1 Tax=Campylobacter upsaliensis TaxID=28080 RepID=UPI00107AE29C|nr:exporting protein [Campylobacter upsaliensis]EAB5281010.1 exporting protein [Campylobacter upsaliensis]EAK3281632.1 exporting protein [Campylobacter upsaliensis]EAL3910716.1 exporting protein [Campylobacter upsaliensis]EEA8806749.1 exporting protein [Campylobacter upsaliensis]EFU2059357.1 exporting protein [Campylobacter upsaliensis]